MATGADVLARVRARGDAVFVEPEGFPLLARYGLACPRILTIDAAAEVTRLAPADLATLPGDRVVVKIASPDILHRSDVGGVRVVPKEADAVVRTLGEMAARLDPGGAARYIVSEFVEHAPRPGHELLLGLRWTDDFGAVVVMAPGGLHADFWAGTLSPDARLAMFAVDEGDGERMARRLRQLPWVRLVVESQRGQAPAVTADALVDAVRALQALGRAHVPDDLSEIEINPLVITPRGLVALDVLGRLGAPRQPAWPPRPLHKLRALYTPASAAILGVSEKTVNVGRIILRNLLREGFPPDRLLVVKAGVDQVDGCRAVPDLASLPERVDLLVLAVGAAQVPAVLEETVARELAESVIVIPGGLEEKAGSETVVGRLREVLRTARGTPWGGPVVNGGNCLGIRSRPGRYDTMFIPATKLPFPPVAETPLAIISQSGAFAIARHSRLRAFNPRYLVTAGNQMDLTVADHLEALAADEHVRVFALYVEGFRPLDGRRVVELARRLGAEGRSVILYRAGRTAAGASASASHTASVAGDYAVTRELATAAGVLVTESIDDFEDGVRLALGLDRRVLRGSRLAAVSNAGFECVAIADSLGAFTLADYAGTTRARLAQILRDARLDGLVDVHNPLDLTPMADDATFEAAVRAVVDDAGVDVVVVGCVPLTAQLQTLPPGEGHPEDAHHPDAVGPRLARLFAATTTPMVMVIDSGPLYDPLADALTSHGVPVFRSADRALRALNAWWRLVQR